MGRNPKTLLRKFHEAKWDEQIILEMSVPGERGILVREAEPEVRREVGSGVSAIPPGLRRRSKPGLPEVNQARVLRHFLHLSQETLGTDVNIDIGEGTCTMKYSPKVHEQISNRNPAIRDVHPLQPTETMQGTLEIVYKLEQLLKEVSGMDRFTFQPSGGAQGVYTSAAMIRAYHESRGDTQRTEAITTMFSHPCDAAAPATAGYKIITIMPDKDGYADIEAFKGALSKRTAGIFITNPEDTGIYNPLIDEFVKAAHEVGALCHTDQANANGILGIARARDAGFDLSQFNLHKTFSVPHQSTGGSVGALGCTAELAEFLPVPQVKLAGEKYYLDYNAPRSIGKVRSFIGNVPSLVKAYAWIMQLGDEGLRQVAICSVLNNNYLMQKLQQIPGVVVRYAPGRRRLEQVRYSWEKLYEDTGVGTEDVRRRMADFGVQSYSTSHLPWIVPQPFTIEPTESFSKDDLDEYVAILTQISKEAYENPEFVKGAPYNSVVHRNSSASMDDPVNIAVTWRQFVKKGLDKRVRRSATKRS
ncbi:MAG: aminomethyl-transferring glycine dehydrogenase subunit GcvPB [Thaumarchaeota archaeon]|nr:aminomethyl-transferring glycine dehydrogenase subunit GcvPB [Nitrososphaerota archaeon]